ncbi:hypothetical protein EOA32_00790 [Mesorhizobium sp. M1A.F.Ca.ET.072.01.1.1]|uniref:hypothetical protein n=1 Tax=Mesorhizobium sp. M1A.F.Ca.ET.072.01.1.1 TaxID=2496753 RepID=UPI000FD4D538|nr:hypothetical protein [Mesorhizobium sp. M1A.F.Ca.ET.072.01.1.1]RUW55588.1 hypothetical protein EOA32_00790 [Mesorhizobium sp. M1A.F.Ca.ET.072.01.1.1]
MPKPDAATSATIGHFYLVIQSHGATFWLSREFTRRGRREKLVLTTTPLYAEAFTTEELPKLTQRIWQQFKDAEILPLECNTRELLPAIIRKTINA